MKNYRQTYPNNLPLEKRWNLIISNLAKAEFMADYYSNILQAETLPHQIEIKRYISRNECDTLQDNSEINSLFTIEELQNGIQQLKPYKATGRYMIDNEMIKVLPENALITILDMFNQS